MGSSALVGSSISSTAGSTASARAIHRRCCWPPERPSAFFFSRSYTIVIVTHNMQQAVRISDRTAFFLLGELVEYGATEQVFSAPAEKRTEDYITGRFG